MGTNDKISKQERRKNAGDKRNYVSQLHRHDTKKSRLDARTA